MGFGSLCGSAMLKLGLMLDQKAVKKTIKCEKCGNVIEIEGTATPGGMDFGSEPGSGLGELCPWNSIKTK